MDKASASKTRAKPKPVAKLVPEYPSGNPRRSTRQCQKRTGSVEDALPSKKAKPPPDQGDNRTGSVIDSLGAYNEAVGENPGGASEALGGLSVSDDIPDDLLNQAMDDHEAKQTKGQAEVVVAQPYFSPSERVGRVQVARRFSDIRGGRGVLIKRPSNGNSRW